MNGQVDERRRGAVRAAVAGVVLLAVAAEFRATRFTGNAGFSEATFAGSAWFDQATFTRDADFSRTTLPGTRYAAGTQQSPWTDFARVRFERDVPSEVERYVSPPDEEAEAREGGNVSSTG